MSAVCEGGEGAHCHQCRQKTRQVGAACQNLKKNNKPCVVKLCSKCLFNRYGEKAEEITEMEEWICPKCRGICNCSVCMKQTGHQPIGRLSNAAKGAGFSSSVPEMLLPEGLNHEQNCFDATHNEIVGTELSSVAGIEVPAEDVGNALEFLQFSSTFGKILKMKNGEAEYILQEILDGRPRKPCPIVQFQKHLLSIIKAEQGDKYVNRKPSGKTPWFDELKRCLGVSEAADYESLSASGKLRLLNLLCVEILGTRKLRRWIEEQNTEADAVRIEPIFASNYSGHVYWKFNCTGESDVLLQYVGKGDTLTLNEKWSLLSAQEKQLLHKNINN